MTKAIIYTRFSPRPNAKECDSCIKQAERCLEYCGRYDYSFLHCYNDKNVSGGILQRPSLLAALDHLEPGMVLVVDSSSRLARDMLVNLTIRHQVEQAGATIEFADGSPCDTTPEGKLFQNILAAFSAYERDRIKLNTKRGSARNRALGKKINGRIPTGMKEDPGNPGMLVKCPKERHGIILACSLRKEKGHPRDAIASSLNCDSRIGPYRGKPWSGRLVDKIIARHSYWADLVDGDLSLEPEFF